MPTLIFVHLNSQIPRYLSLNLRGMTKLFPNLKIVLVHNQEKIRGIIPGIVFHKFEPSQIFLEIEDSLIHPKTFRNNFWFTAIGRFEAIHQYMQISGEKVIHVESDVILAKDFPFSQFQELEFDLAFPLVARNRGVASTLFIGTTEAARKLVDFSLDACKIQPDISDMEILSKIVNNEDLKVLLLPIAQAKADSFHNNNLYPDLTSLRYGTELFGGIFDGNDIGVYLYGTNPRNRRGISTVGEEVTGNYSSIRLWRFKYSASRNFIELRDGPTVLPIFSIHATCKKLSLFWLYSRPFNLKHFHNKDSSVIKIYPNIVLLMVISKFQKKFSRSGL
jgi:hypothetical protein